MNNLQLKKKTTITNKFNQNRTPQSKTSENVYIRAVYEIAYEFECQNLCEVRIRNSNTKQRNRLFQGSLVKIDILK